MANYNAPRHPKSTNPLQQTHTIGDKRGNKTRTQFTISFGLAPFLAGLAVDQIASAF